MFGTIRRHQTWLWVIIAGITILTFVIWGPTTNVSRNGRGSSDAGSDNFPVIGTRRVTRAEFDNAFKVVSLDYYLRSGQKLDDSATATFETYRQVFFTRKEEDLGIQVSTEAAAEFGRKQILEPMARSSKGPVSFDTFVKEFLKPGGFDEVDFERYLRAQLGREQLIAITGLSGQLVTPGEVESLYRAEHQDRATAMMYFSSSNYTSSVSATPEAIQSYYSNEVANYRIPERVQVAYVKFNVTNEFDAARAAITNLDGLVNEYYLQAGTNVPGKTPEEAKAKLRDALIKMRAMTNEMRVAYQFANDLALKTNRNVEGFEALAKEKKLTVENPAPFDMIDGPTNLDVPRGFLTAAFSLSKDEPFSGVVQAEDGFYMLAFKAKIPSENPPFTNIAAKVTEDYRNSEAIKMAQQIATKFHVDLTNGMAQGKSVSNLCAEARVTLEQISPFSLSSTNPPPEIKDRLSLGLLRQAAFGTEVGSVTPPVGTRDGAFILYVEKTLPVDEVTMKKELPDFLALVRRGKMSDGFNQWMFSQLQRDQEFARVWQKLADAAQGRQSGTRSRQ